jgi:uncharacterized protein YwqG
MDITERLRATRLAPHAPAIAALGLPAAELVPRPDVEPPQRAGASRFGGLADLPHGVRWPRARGRPLTLLLQVDLADLAGFGGAVPVPPSGTLHFFYDAVAQPWGYRFSDRRGWRVLYTPATVPLRRYIPRGLTPELVLPAVAISFVPTMTYPSPLSDVAPECVDNEEDLYRALVVGDDRIRHLLLGHPDPIQSDPVPRGWVSLLQLDPDPFLGTMWGDSGKLHFTITETALARLDFSGVWLELQCC